MTNSQHERLQELRQEILKLKTELTQEVESKYDETRFLPQTMELCMEITTLEIAAKTLAGL